MSSAMDAANNGTDDSKRKRDRDVIGWWDWLGRLFGGSDQAVIGIAALSLATGVFAITIRDAVVSYQRATKAAFAVETTKWGEDTIVFPIEGTDSKGRSALFDVVVLDKEFGWLRGSTTELSKSNRKLSTAELKNDVLGGKVREGLSASREVIAVGLASQEGDVAEETHRAGMRARQTAQWLQDGVPEKIPMWTLNLGRYLEPCATCETGNTSWQRPFIVIAVRRADEGTDIGEALAIAMTDKTNLPSPASYSAFALSRYR